MNILFIIPDMIKAENLAIQILSACLKQANHKTMLVYSNSPDFIDQVKSFQPQIIAFSVTSGMHFDMLRVNRELKDKYGDFISIFGGPHVTFKPQIIEQDNSINIVCVGEGEGAMVDLANAAGKGEDYSKIKNLWVRTKEGIKKNPVRELASIEKLPFYDRTIFSDADPAMRNCGTNFVMVSRGCPYHCTYCFNQEYKAMYKGLGSMLRLMSIPRAISEIKHLLSVAPNTNFIEFHDDIFPYHRKDQFEEFYELYKKEIGVNFFTYLPPKTGNSALIKGLKEMGCYYAGIGFECGDENIRKNVLNRPAYSNQDFIDNIQECNEVGIKTFTTNLLGLPIENSLENDLNSMMVNIRAKPTIAYAYITYPYPGTELSRIAIRNGFFKEGQEIVVNNKSDTIFDFHGENTAIEKNALLFGIIVDFPFLLNFRKLLMRIPKKILNFLYFAHRGYRYKITLNPHFRVMELFESAKILFRYLKFAGKERATNLAKIDLVKKNSPN